MVAHPIPSSPSCPSSFLRSSYGRPVRSTPSLRSRYEDHEGQRHRHVAVEDAPAHEREGGLASLPGDELAVEHEPIRKGSELGQHGCHVPTPSAGTAKPSSVRQVAKAVPLELEGPSRTGGQVSGARQHRVGQPQNGWNLTCKRSFRSARSYQSPVFPTFPSVARRGALPHRPHPNASKSQPWNARCSVRPVQSRDDSSTSAIRSSTAATFSFISLTCCASSSDWPEDTVLGFANGTRDPCWPKPSFTAFS